MSRNPPQNLFAKWVGMLLKVPIIVYRYTLSAFIGRECRYLPTCSEYAHDAIEINGPWRGFWVALARLSRCHPWGASGYDPVPDVTDENHPYAPWRYGRWSGRQTDRRLDKGA